MAERSRDHDIEVIEADEVVGLARCGSVFVAVWRGVPTRERIERGIAVYDAIAVRTRCPPAMLAFLEEGSAAPAVADLPFVAQTFDSRRVPAAAAVLAGRDPWFSSMLDAMLSMLTMRRLAGTTKLCADLSEAAAWMSTRVPHDGPSDPLRVSLRRSVELVRASMRS